MAQYFLYFWYDSPINFV